MVVGIIPIGAFCKSAGISQELSALGLVAGTLEIPGIDKGLCKIYRVVVDGLPVQG